MANTDLTQRADLTRHDRGTGALRTRRPDYVDFLPPCNDACPAGENIQAWLALAQDGQHEAAWREIYGELAPAVAGYFRARRMRDADDLTGEVFLEVVNRGDRPAHRCAFVSARSVEIGHRSRRNIVDRCRGD